MKKPILLAALAATALFAGCENSSGKWKENVQQALGKQVEMKNYRFSGEADLKLGNLPQGKEMNAITSSLMSMFLSGKLEWSGVLNTDPMRLEADLKSTPAGSSTALALPIILKDNKLYVNIPLLSKQDEYYAIDMAQLGSTAGQSGAMNADSLKNVAKVSADASLLLIRDLDAKWFKQADPVALKDGKQATVIKLDVTDKNKKAISDAFQSKWPEVVDSLRNNGLLGAAQADQLKAETNAQVAPGGQFAVAIDPDGFIRDETIKLTLTTTGKDGAAQTRELHIHTVFDDINLNPPFAKETPKQVKPFDDVLKALNPKK